MFVKFVSFAIVFDSRRNINITKRSCCHPAPDKCLLSKRAQEQGAGSQLRLYKSAGYRSSQIYKIVPVTPLNLAACQTIARLFLRGIVAPGVITANLAEAQPSATPSYPEPVLSCAQLTSTYLVLTASPNCAKTLRNSPAMQKGLAQVAAQKDDSGSQAFSKSMRHLQELSARARGTDKPPDL